jgi:hypothetical protein
MSNYTKATNFASKDSLPVGDANKKVKGVEIDNEFNAIANAISTKANLESPELSGVPTAPTAAAATNTTQIATTAMVQSALAQTGVIGTTQLADDAVTADKLADTAVTADTYGDASNIPQITVDAQGRLTGVTEIAVQTVTESAGEAGSFTLPGGLIVEWGITAQQSFTGGAYSQGSNVAVTNNLTNNFTNIYHAQATVKTANRIYAYVTGWDASAGTISVGARLHEDVGSTRYGYIMWIVIGD